MTTPDQREENVEAWKEDVATQEFIRFANGVYEEFDKALEMHLGLVEGCIPQQALNEGSNCLSHLVQFFNPGLLPSQRLENLGKAKNHLVRATLDIHKLIYFRLAKRIAGVVESPVTLLSLKAGMSFWDKHRLFSQLAGEARRHEMRSVGIESEKTVGKYKEATSAGLSILETIDRVKTNKVTLIKWCYWALGFVLGGLVGFLVDRLFHF